MILNLLLLRKRDLRTVQSLDSVFPSQPSIVCSVLNSMAHHNGPIRMPFKSRNYAHQVVVSWNEIVIEECDNIKPSDSLLERGVALR